MRFHLGEKDLKYIDEKGMDVIRSHAEDFVAEKLGPAFPKNDGKQTPMRGHPVFIAQHACACCCRGCLEKWYHVPQGVELSTPRRNYSWEQTSQITSMNVNRKNPMNGSACICMRSFRMRMISQSENC